MSTWLKKLFSANVQTAACSNRSNQQQQKQRQQAGQETNEVFTGDLEKFSGDCSGCQRETFYISLNYDTELKSTAESSDRENTFKLSDGNIITTGAECFRYAEILVQPSFIGKEASGIHDASSQNVMKCDADTCKDLHARVVLLRWRCRIPRD